MGAALFGLAVPRLIGIIVDGIKANLDGGEYPRLLLDISLVIGFTLLANACRFFMRWLLIGASRRIEYELRNDFFAHLLLLDQPFYQKTSIGDLMARATNDLNAVRTLLGPGIMYTLNYTVTLTIALAIMLSISARLTLISLLPLPLLSVVVYFLSSHLHRGFTAIQERFSHISTLIQENFSGIRIVKAFGREDNEARRFAEANEDYFQKNLKMVRIMALFMPSMRLLSGAAVILVLLYGGRGVMNGHLSLGDLVAFIQYIGMLSWPMTALGWVTGVVQRGSASWKRILEVLDTPPRITGPARLTESLPSRGELELRSLSFAYGDRPVLHDVTLRVPAGGSLGILGPTGSGKSTLLRLIPRLLDTPPGTVFLDGRDVTDMPLAELRQRVAWVGQEPLLFSETLGENALFGRPAATASERDEAARDAAILAEVEGFPAQWETLIGERGINLSGGQKQRVCLARALLKDSAIYILDAPFSSVDTHTEELILQALRSRLRDRSLILVSHRVSTMRLADTICVLDEGRIVERGDHETLLALGGLYSRLHERQLLEESLSEGETGT